jgi:hypothetical protein
MQESGRHLAFAPDRGKDRGQFYRMMKAAGLEPERFR